jgi:spore germination protein
VKKEALVTVLLFIAALALALSGRYLDSKKLSDSLLTPFANSFSVFSLIDNQEQPDHIVYGFLPYWQLNKIKHIQLDKLTDIAYFGLILDPDGTIRKLDKDGNAEPGYNQWRNNKELHKLIIDAKQRGVRFSLTVVSHEDIVSDQFLYCETCWDRFLTEITREMDYQNVTDLHLNFEYAGRTDPATADRFTRFADYVNNYLDDRYGDSYLVVSTYADSLRKPRVTKIPDLEKVVDGIFIMAYDFHYRGSEITGPVAPITTNGAGVDFDINSMLKDHLRNVSPSKLIMGVPYYGYDWIVSSPYPNSQTLAGNVFRGHSKSQTYENIMELILIHRPYIQWDTLGLSPFFTYTSPDSGITRQLYYESEDSLRVKYQLIKKHNLGGVGIWALGYDGGYQELWKLLGEEFIMQ